ncbi:hypothetical protein QM012_002869 [Aureobasidium pullulans]|uniref:DUF8004 domain-containing protein n=1 Tax=Aureobasidium pullulans TaxID=5580 RepID=A0ABR0TAS5_AURPU
MDIRDTQKVLLPGPPTPACRKSNVPNFSRILTIRAHGSDSPVKKRKKPEQAVMRNPSKLSSVKRWDAQSHKSADWDGLRRDQELWQQDGDCLVHLYGQGKSKRRASFKMSYALVEATAGASFLSKYMASDSASCSESLDGTTSSTSSIHAEYELFIPAPNDALREEAYCWHLTTRNFFAYLANKPLVGSKLGKTLIDLLERIELFCSDKTSNLEDFLSYARRQGYSRFINRPDYALAFLNLAEKLRLKDLWIDAFAHCVGMNDQLDLSADFQDVSKVTKALITRSYLEMDLHLGRVSKALRNFLEDELAPTHLGLPAPARNHLDRFRSFLQSYYVNKFGYWPPETGHIMDKGLLRSMHQEFQMLYDYLVDGESSPSRLLTGGICVVQNVDAFNMRHKYEPLPHSCPLLPDYHSLEYRTSSQKGLRSLRLTSKASKVDQSVTARAALSAATNKIPSSSALVRNYIYFESELTFRPEEKLSIGDARKVRWIAIYTILQMLTNAIRAPEEVVNADAVPYHLCLLTTGMPPWNEDTKTSTSVSSLAMPIKTEGEGSDEPAFTIHPDCEDNDYFSHKLTPKRCDSHSSLRPQPLRISTPGAVNRNSSIRSLHRSLTSNFSFPTRRTSIKSSVPSSNSAEQTGSSVPAESPGSKRFSGYSFAISEEESLDYLNPHQPQSALTTQFYHLPEARTPTLDTFMLDTLASPEGPSTPSSFTSSTMSPASASSNMWDSSPHSVNSDDLDTQSWYDRRSSAGVYNMDHDSVCSDTQRKSSGSSCSCSGANSPTPNLSTLTASSAAAATAKLLNSHAGLGLQYQSQQQTAQMPAWWGVPGDRTPTRSFGVSVPEDVPEHGVMAFKPYCQEFIVERGVESTVDIFDAVSMLN